MSEGQLPASWESPPIQDCCELNPKLDKSVISDTKLVHFVPMPAVEALVNKVYVTTLRPFGEVKKGYTPFAAGDVIFAKITPCMENGKVAVVPELEHELALGSTEFHVIRPLGELSPHWFFYYLSSRAYRSEAEHNMTGAVGQRRVPIDFIAQSTIPLPPLAEQKRIVAKIEELFSELDAGEDSLRRARRQLGVYRQSLLKQAFEGKLTRHRKIEAVPLRYLITDLTQGWSPKCELNRMPRIDEWAIIKTTAIQHCRYDDSEAKPLPPSFEPRPSIEIKDGDFLMTRKGPRARAGVSCYVRKTRPLLMVCDTVYRFRCIEEKVHPLYLELALNSPDVLRAIDRQKAGISESGLSLTHTKIGTVEIPLCSLPEQQEIVRVLDAQFSVIEQTEREIDAALKRIEALRQSILKKAFTGQLVPPACRQAGKTPEEFPQPRAGKWWVYVLKCSDGSFYKGFTDNLPERWRRHLSGTGAKWTKQHPPVELLYWEEHWSEASAIERERYLKSGSGREWFQREVVENPHKYEPASVLIARIRAEREANAAKPARKHTPKKARP